MPLEAVIGAIYLDGGFANAKEFMSEIHSDRTLSTKSSFMIARLSCRRLSRETIRRELHYQLIGEEGPDHDKQFVVEVQIGGKVHWSRECGHTKKAAEQEAAYQALLH